MPTLAELCPPPYELVVISVHQREPVDENREITVCALP